MTKQQQTDKALADWITRRLEKSLECDRDIHDRLVALRKELLASL